MRVRFTYFFFFALASAAQATIPSGFEVMTTGLSYSAETGLRAYARVGENCSEEHPVWSGRDTGAGVTEWSFVRGKVDCTSYGVYSYVTPPEFQVDSEEDVVVHIAVDGTRTLVAKMLGGFGQVTRIALRPGARIEVRPEGVRFYFRDLPVSRISASGSTFQRLHRAD